MNKVESILALPTPNNQTNDPKGHGDGTKEKDPRRESGPDPILHGRDQQGRLADQEPRARVDSWHGLDRVRSRRPTGSFGIAASGPKATLGRLAQERKGTGKRNRRLRSRLPISKPRLGPLRTGNPAKRSC